MQWVVVLSVALLAVVLIPGPGSAPDAGAAVGDEAVRNGSVGKDLAAWTAGSDAGEVRLSRVTDARAPVAGKTAIHIQRSGGAGTWAMALAGLRTPETFFRVGRTYRMQAHVRDVHASGRPIGILLANGNYRSRPTDTSEYAAYGDDSWHLLTRTFVCTAAGLADTGLYLELPPTGPLHWHITGASIREVNVARPGKVSGPPTTVLSFDGAVGSAPDPAQWNHEVGGHGWGNDEVQTYTDAPANSNLDGSGRLVITARREPVTGPDGIARDYTSARLTTQGKVVIEPGSYVEAAIRLPVGAGVWPALWLLGTNITEVGWPASGELDIVEVVGADPMVARSATHQSSQADPTKDHPYGWREAGGSVNLGHPLDSATHVYGVYFDGQTIRFYIDRTEHLALWKDDALASGRTWPYGRSQFLLLNVAVGGTGDPSDTAFPRSMTIGAISIWRGGTPF